MKSLVIATILAASAFAASAMSGNGEIYGQDKERFVSTKTRAEVVTELRAAVAAGTIASGDADLQRHQARSAPATSSLTRAEVRMEVAKLAAQGKLFQNNHSSGRTYRN
jgi:hypothetical protein